MIDDVFNTYLELIFTGNWETSYPEWASDTVAINLSFKEDEGTSETRNKRIGKEKLFGTEGIIAKIPLSEKISLGVLVLAAVLMGCGYFLRYNSLAGFAIVLYLVAAGALYFLTGKRAKKNALKNVQRHIKKRIMPLIGMLKSLDCYTAEKVQWVLNGTKRKNGWVGDIIRILLLPAILALIDSILKSIENKYAVAIYITVVLLLATALFCFLGVRACSDVTLARKEFVEDLEYIYADIISKDSKMQRV